MKIKTLKAIIVLCMSHSSHAFDCNTDASQIDDVIRIPSDHSGYKVISTGRSYFYTAPSLNCIDKEKFLIKGDTVDAYLDHGKFTLVLSPQLEVMSIIGIICIYIIHLQYIAGY